ncbi:efflux RND transporter periplasmic adaptor subunit [Flavobacteriaceae bacterium 14752]|uniref:efflux RND transporter periplasmic adaptor subunit n=1 Tax=Mesohalobacter salilacus TaxID=2491711 RepID=UPI000F632515|nr:efflux RND transporter periplasmic adaptor subunit [Flavobacteriaceae bacterium 14752]
MQKTLFFLLACLAFACQNQNDKNSKNNTITKPVKSSAIQVNVTQAKDTTFYKQIIANGRVEARYRSDLRFRTAEVLDQIFVQNGDRVKKGQKLAQLNQDNVKNNLLQAQVNLATAENKMLEMKAEFQVSKKPDSLIRPEVLSNIQIRSGLREANARLKQAQIALQQTILKAEFDGVVANLITKEGNYISPSEVFCTLISQDNLDVIFNLMEDELSYVSKGMSVDIQPFSNSTKTYTAEVIEVNPFVDENGLVRIKAHIQNPDRDLFDGMNVKVFIKQPIEDVLVVPKSALVLRSNREVIFTLKDSLSKWNYVKVKDQNTSHYAISEGLNSNDTIIISNNINLSHDATVDATFIKAKN